MCQSAARAPARRPVFPSLPHTRESSPDQGFRWWGQPLQISPSPRSLWNPLNPLNDPNGFRFISRKVKRIQELRGIVFRSHFTIMRIGNKVSVVAKIKILFKREGFLLLAVRTLCNSKWPGNRPFSDYTGADSRTIYSTDILATSVENQVFKNPATCKPCNAYFVFVEHCRGTSHTSPSLAALKMGSQGLGCRGLGPASWPVFAFGELECSSFLLSFFFISTDFGSLWKVFFDDPQRCLIAVATLLF